MLGCAAIAINKVIPAMQRSQRCEVVAIGSRDADRAAEAAAQLGIARSHGSYEDVLADEGVEAVYIPLPNHLHAEWTERAAAAGKHVLCEKPLGLGVAEVEGMIEACRAAGVLLMEAFMYRLHPLWQRTHELVADGTIGELRAIQARFTYCNLDPTNIRNIADYGGGAVMDIGCYPINVARWFFGGEPDSVSAAVSPRPDVRDRRARRRRCSTSVAGRRRSRAPRSSSPTSVSTCSARRAGSRSRSPSTSRPICRPAWCSLPAAIRRWRPT